MRKLLLFQFFLIFSLCLYSQSEWAPIGAKWYFNQPSSEQNNYVLFESKKDTMVLGKNCRIIEVRVNGNQLISKEYIYQVKDSVFYFNSYTNQFHLIYNLSASIGDTIIVHENKFKPTKAFFSYYDTINNFKYKVIEIDSVQVSGKWLKRQKIKDLKNSSWGLTKPTGGDNDYIIDKIGSITYFFGVFSGTLPEENLSILRCYNSLAIEYRNLLWTNSCDFTTNIYMEQIDTKLVYPNPVRNQININTIDAVESIQIYDVNGSLTVFNKNAKSIDIDKLNNGMYFLRVKTKQKIYFQKIFKQ